MNKTLKKIIPLLVLTGIMSACTYYSPKPGPKEHVIGTYELATYEMHKLDADGNEILNDDGSYVKYDRKQEIGAIAYFSIADDGYAFYAYKDKNTPAKVSQMFATFSYNGENEENPDYVRSVSLTDGITHLYEDEKYVGCLNEPSMGFRDELFKKTLHYNLSGHMLFQPERKIPYQYVLYKKVSDEASLEKVNSLMGTNVKFDRPYEMKAMQGYAVYRCQPKDNSGNQRGIYEYAILDLNTYVNGKLNLYYSLASEPGQQVKQLSVSIDEKGHSLKLEGFGKTFYDGGYNSLPLGNFSSRSEDYTEEDLYTSEWFTKYYGDNMSITDIIEQERTPIGPYVMHRAGSGEKQFASMQYDNEGNLYIDDLALQANEEFAINTGNGWKYFEDYLDEGTANGKVVQGGAAENEQHYLKATEAGEYDLKVDTFGKIHIVHS